MKTLKIAIVAFLSALAVNTVTAQEVKVTTEKRYYHHHYYEPEKRVIVREHPEHTTIIREHEYGGYRPHHRVIKTETRRYNYDTRYRNLNDDPFDNDRRWDDDYDRR